MPFITWTDQIEINIEEIDNQHKKLFHHLNLLYDYVISNADRKTLIRVLDELVDNTVLHFKTEEGYMQEYNYPKFTEHKEEHDKLTKQVVDLQKEFHEGGETISLEMMDFLHDWLKNHTAGTDKRFGNYIASLNNQS